MLNNVFNVRAVNKKKHDSAIQSSLHGGFYYDLSFWHHILIAVCSNIVCMHIGLSK